MAARPGLSASAEPADQETIHAMTVASWYPAIDDTSVGRFVADQVHALRRGGRVRPVVVSFEPATLVGGPLDRRRQAAAVRFVADAAIGRDARVFAEQGWSGAPGVPVARLPIPSGARGFGYGAHLARDREHALQAFGERLTPGSRTVVHAHRGYPDGAAAVVLADALEAPLVITEHATFVSQQLAKADVRAAYVRGVRRAARLVAVSETLAAELRSALPEYASKVVVLPNAVAVDDFRPGAIGERVPDSLLHVGYRVHSKGIDVLLRAFAIVRSTRPRATLRLIGRAPGDALESEWRELADRLGVADATVFEDSRLRDGVAAAMARASVLVHPSRRETFGVVPVEALAAGMPVVASDIGPLREILGPAPDALGALVPPDDPPALAAAILRVLDSRADYVPEVLRAAVEGRYGADAVADAYAHLYADSLGEAGVRHASGRPPHPAPIVPPQPLDGPVVLVAFDPTSSSRLLRLVPSAVRERLHVVTDDDAVADPLPGDLRGATSAELPPLPPGHEDHLTPGRLDRRAGTLLAQAFGALVAFLPRWRAARARDARRRAALDRAIDEHRPVVGRLASLPIVCVAGLDYLIARSAVSRGDARPQPGGIRWLVDALAASPAAESGSTGRSPNADGTLETR